CPRIVYYQELLAIKPNKPLRNAQGEEFHKKVEQLEKRRSFIRYGLNNAIRHFNLSIKSHKYKLHGIVDCVIETDTNLYVVEYKTNPN
ncbi:PD-(D/E)XK nuclease family protein, partial [Francisella tularensis subsp. holarctica]